MAKVYVTKAPVRACQALAPTAEFPESNITSLICPDVPSGNIGQIAKDQVPVGTGLLQPMTVLVVESGLVM